MTDLEAGKSISQRLLRLFEKQVAIDFLVYFRVVFAIVMLWWVVKYLVVGLVDGFYIAPVFHFHYEGFAFVKPLAGEGARYEFYLLGACAVLMLVGYCYRAAAVVFAVGFTHVFLSDKALYQNHYYLVVLLSWLIAILPAHAAFSFDAWQRPAIRRTTAPVWMLYLLQFAIALPYFFGGIAKVSPDWLAGQPMGMALESRTWYPVIGPLFTEHWFVLMFAWGGLLFDLLIVPALLWKRTRTIAFLAAAMFHLANATLWTIGIFPWLMIFATAIFFEPGWPSAIWRQIRRQESPTDSATTPSESAIGWTWGRRLTFAALAIFVGLQCMIPLRHYAFAGNDNWTEEAHYFSWHMLLRGKKCGIRYYATDPKTGQTGTVDLRRYITPHQATRFGRDPRMIHQLARFIADDLRYLGLDDIEIRVLAYVSLNGRRPQLMIDPTIDLGAEPESYATPTWIQPLTEPLRDDPWDVPLEKWEQHLAIPEHFQLTQLQPKSQAQP